MMGHASPRGPFAYAGHPRRVKVRSIKPWWRHASSRQVATSRCTPRWRMLPRVIGGPWGCLAIAFEDSL